MQFKILTTLLLSSLTLASPVAVAQEAEATASSNANTSGPDRVLTLPVVPTSIMTVLATAIPASWYQEILNPASRAVMRSEIEAGTMPAWYNALPASVKAWASSAGDFANNFVAATPTAIAIPLGSAGSGSEGVLTATPVATAAADTTKSKAQQTASETTSKPKAHKTAAETTASSASETAAPSKSSAPSSSTSTGGAPVATGSVAMSVAGAVSLLGLALAL